MSEQESGEKSFEPTPKKLEDARKKGDVPKSTDLNTAASYIGFWFAIAALGPVSLNAFATANQNVFSSAGDVARAVFERGELWFLANLLAATGVSLMALFALPAVAVLVSLVAQRAIVFAPDKLAPKLSRISPVSGVKNKFGANGIVEFLKSATKLVVVSLLAFWFLAGRVGELISASAMSAGQVSALISELIVDFLLIVFAITLLIGAVDYVWQMAEHIRKNRMTHKEVQDEAKESEGDPHLKQSRRQKGYDIAMNQMLADVPKADVIVVNPTHYAVALKWDRSSGQAPICVAKGVDEIAARIREVGADADIPIYSDPPSARAIFASVEIGHQILPEHYRAIAAAIRFAEDLRAKARPQRG